MRLHHHQHLKQHPKLSAPPLSISALNSTGASTVISTANCMPPSTRPSVSQSGASTSARNCMPPSTRPSILQNSTSTSAPNYMAPYLAKRHLHQHRNCMTSAWLSISQSRTSTNIPNYMPPLAPETACPLATAVNLAKQHLHQQLHAP